MRVSGLLLSALVALGAVAVAPQLGAVVSASSSPAQTKLDSLKSLIESSAGANPPAVCSGAPNSVPSAPGPSRGPPPATVGDYCAACKALLDFPSTARLPAACDSLPDGKTKDACTKVVQPYLTECGNAAILSEVDKVKVAKNGALTPADAQMFCNRMKNGAPATLMVAANNMNNWPAGNGDAFCSSSSLMEVATSITTEAEAEAEAETGSPASCTMCQRYIKASRASRDQMCEKVYDKVQCAALKKAVQSVDLYDEGTNSCYGPQKLHRPCKEAILCGLVPMENKPDWNGKKGSQQYYCTPFHGYRKGVKTTTPTTVPKSPFSSSKATPPTTARSPVGPPKATPTSVGSNAAPPQAKKKSFLEAGADALTPAEMCQFCQAYLASAKEYRLADCMKAADTNQAKQNLCKQYNEESTPKFARYEADGCYLANSPAAVKCPPEAICTFVDVGKCKDSKHVPEPVVPSVAADALPPAVSRSVFLEGQTMTRAEAECSMCQLITTVAPNRRAQLCASQLIADAQKELCRSVYQGVYLKNEAAFKEVDQAGCFSNGKKLDVCPPAAVCAMIGAQCPSSEANGFSLKQQSNNNNNQNNNASNQNKQQGNKKDNNSKPSQNNQNSNNQPQQNQNQNKNNNQNQNQNQNQNRK